MMLPAAAASLLEATFRTRIMDAQAVGGGCIAHAARVETEDGPLFVKWSSAEAAATFPAEAAGLNALRQAASGLVVPEPLFLYEGDAGVPGVLVLEWIEPGARGDGFWEAFGAGLAQMHRHTGEQYGFERDNFIGRLPQQNTWHESWPAFYRTRRIEPQVRFARATGTWNERWSRHLDRMLNRLEDVLPGAPAPSILHGDLWSGNFLVTERGTAALVDPAAYYGHREADLAMTELFGGFDRRFYAAYEEAGSLEPGYEVRRQVYNLYHLINHLNHFGARYAGSVEEVLKRF